MIMDGYIGQIILFPRNWVPVNWMVCDGRSLVVNDNQAFAVVVGFNEGDEYFYLPNLESPHSDLHYIICSHGQFPSRT